jgi:hypothetical protein
MSTHIRSPEGNGLEPGLPPAGTICRQVRSDHLPLCIGQVTGIAPGLPSSPARTGYDDAALNSWGASSGAGCRAGPPAGSRADGAPSVSVIAASRNGRYHWYAPTVATPCVPSAGPRKARVKGNSTISQKPQLTWRNVLSNDLWYISRCHVRRLVPRTSRSGANNG